MARKYTQASGRITLRVQPEVHARLHAVAEGIGTDLTKLLNTIIQLTLPEFEARAAKLRAERKQEMERTLGPNAARQVLKGLIDAACLRVLNKYEQASLLEFFQADVEQPTKGLV